MNSIKIERLQKEILHIVNIAFQGEIADSRLFGVEFTHAKLASDLGVLKLFFHCLDNEIPQEKIIGLLNRSSGFIKNQIAGAHIMRFIPQIIFEFDDTAQRVERIEQILQSIAYEKRNNEDYYGDDDFETDIQQEDLEDYSSEDDQYDQHEEDYEFGFDDEKIPDDELDDDIFSDEDDDD